MFEALIRDVAVRFGLGDKARDLLTALLATLFDEQGGGLVGMAAQFRQRGLDDTFRSWIGDAAPRAVTPEQLEDVLGSSEISRLADRLEMVPDMVAVASSVMLPRLVRLVTPNGELPRGVPAGVNDYLDAIGHAHVLHRAAHVDAITSPGLGWLKWPLLAAIVLAFGYCVLQGETEPAAPSLRRASQ
jgi:uncharacterized protein YidB (DUF937 family)